MEMTLAPRLSPTSHLLQHRELVCCSYNIHNFLVKRRQPEKIKPPADWKHCKRSLSFERRCHTKPRWGREQSMARWRAECTRVWGPVPLHPMQNLRWPMLLHSGDKLITEEKVTIPACPSLSLNSNFSGFQTAHIFAFTLRQKKKKKVQMVLTFQPHIHIVVPPLALFKMLSRLTRMWKCLCPLK